MSEEGYYSYNLLQIEILFLNILCVSVDNFHWKGVAFFYM